METFIDTKERLTFLFAVNSAGLYSSHKCEHCRFRGWGTKFLNTKLDILAIYMCISVSSDLVLVD